MTSHGRAIRESNRTTTSSPSPLLSPPITSREASPVRSQVSRAPARRRQRQRTTWRGQPAMSASSSSRELSPASAVSNSSAQGSGNHDARKEPSDSRRTPNGGSTAAGSERVTANPNFSSSDSIVSTAKQALPSSSPSLPLHSSAVKAVRAGEESRSHSHPRSQSVNIVPQSTAATYRSSGSGTRTSQTKSSPGRPVGALSSDSSNLGVSRTPSIVLVSSSPTSARPSEPPSTPAPMLVLSGDDASDELEEPVPEPTKVRGMSTVAPKLETVQEGSDPATTAAALTESK